MKLIHSNFETVALSVLKDFALNAGSYWFSKEALRFFKSKLPRTAIGYNDSYYFISSEQFRDEARKYTIRCMTGVRVGQMLDVTTVGEFQEFATQADAKKALISYINSQPRMNSL